MASAPYIAGPELGALTQALRCPPEHPLRRKAEHLIRRALRHPTKREAAAELRIHEAKLSKLLKEHPELVSNTRET